MNQVTINSIIKHLEKTKDQIRILQQQRFSKSEKAEIIKQIKEAYDAVEKGRYLISKL